MFVSYVDRLPRWASPQQYGRSKKLALMTLAGVFIISWLFFFRESIPHFSRYQLSTSSISNSTLGFQKIYALGLPGREDRIKPLLNAANATNLTLTVLNAVKDVEIDKNDYPSHWDAESHKPGELGCLASHVRTWNLMIANNISSALILESDADWDLRIRDSMYPLAKGVRTLVDWPFTIQHHNLDLNAHPYGDSWDILWIGHCGSNRDGNIRSYAWNDTTVPPKNREYWFDTGLKNDQYVPGTRTVFQFGRTTCSSGYAVSLQGALKLAAYFEKADDNLDLMLSRLCSQNTDMTCLSVWPQIITAANSKSNIEHDGDNDVAQGPPAETDEVAGGSALQYSARVNAKQILESGVGYVPREKWHAAWDTCWAINPYKGYSWEMVKMNQTTGDPIFFEPKEEGTVLSELELQQSNTRARRALAVDPY